MSSTASRLSAEIQISTSLELFASAIFFGVNCLIEGGGTGEIADRQIDEDQFGHRRLLFGGFRAKDERAQANPTPHANYFDRDFRENAPSSSWPGSSRPSTPCF